jgi:hypothetical protein
MIACKEHHVQVFHGVIRFHYKIRSAIIT